MLNKEEVVLLQKNKIGIEPMEMKSTDNPNQNGMHICNVYKGKKLINTISGNSSEEVIQLVENYLKEYLKTI